jgi:predicted DNA-binding ribbon-helix-helix protein
VPATRRNKFVAATLKKLVLVSNRFSFAMKIHPHKHSIVIAGRKTSVSLEDAFWDALKIIAAEREVSVSDLVAAIDAERQAGNLSSAVRLFVLQHYQSISRGPAVGAVLAAPS